MDAIEAARRRAASIHHAALAEGADPWNPLDLVIREVEREGFAAEAIEPGAQQLDGALAKFLPDIGLILYSDSGTPFERAFLIAHEFGHALLGDAAGACVVDMERPAEAAAEAAERVVAHGPRQRREIQMDMFAREFLMPRPFVRRCHLDENMGLLAIAGKLGAPAATVAQQLFDALLIPDAEDDLPEPVRNLRNSQRDAAEHAAPFLLEAGPGTGKTEALVARVTWLLGQGVDPRKILVLTYSNKAAAELSERIAGDNADALAAMWIGTFHAFGYDQLNVYGDQIGRNKNARVLDRAASIALLEHELPRLGLKHLRNISDPTSLILDILAAISRAQDEVCDPARYRELAEAALADALASDEPVEEVRAAAILAAEELVDIAAIYARYDELKEKEKLVDFGDLVMLAVRILETVPQAEEVISRYDHVLVDEYQDVNEASTRMLKAICPDGVGLWAVGDAQQSIYRFRGASSRNMTRFSQDFPEAKTARLLINFRSRPEIVDLISQFGKDMVRKVAPGDPKPPAFDALGSHKGPCGIKPNLTVIRDKSMTIPAIADRIDEAVSAGGAYGDHCVLVSGNDRLADHGAELEALGLPVLFLGSLFERPEIKDLLCFLTLLEDPWAAGLLRIARLPEFEMGLPDVASAIRKLREADDARPDWHKRGDLLAGDLSAEGLAAMRRLADVLGDINPAAHPAAILSELLLDRTRIAARMAQSDETGARVAAMAVWQFMNFVRAQPGSEGGTIARLIARIRRLLRLSDDRELRQLPAAAKGVDAIRLMTIHGAKGLQFHTVHLPGLNRDTFPKAGRRPRFSPPEGMIANARGTVAEEHAASHEEEQECLFYVALSRAKERLHLYRASHKAGGDVVRPESPFVERLGSLIDPDHLVPSRELPPRADLTPIDVLLPASWDVESWVVDMYRTCPRRFLYMHLLRTGGKTERAAYGRIHEIARDLCETLAKQDQLPDAEAAAALVRSACAVPEIADHGHAEDLIDVAHGIVRRYLESRAGYELQSPRAFDHWAGATRIIGPRHEILKGPDGLVVRMVRTGHYREDDAKSLSARLLAAEAAAQLAGARVEIVHLADDRPPLPVPLASGGAKRFATSALKVASDIRDGNFRVSADARRCSACPAFLVCEALPDGKLDCSV